MVAPCWTGRKSCECILRRRDIIFLLFHFSAKRLVGCGSDHLEGDCRGETPLWITVGRGHVSLLYDSCFRVARLFVLRLMSLTLGSDFPCGVSSHVVIYHMECPNKGLLYPCRTTTEDPGSVGSGRNSIRCLVQNGADAHACTSGGDVK